MIKLDWRCPTCDFINDKSTERPNCWNCAQNIVAPPQKQPPPSISKTLEEHESSHGSFQKNADLFAWYTNNTTFIDANLTPIQRLVLTQIFLKISRILNGDNNFFDHWHDICGYSTLAKKEIQP